MATLDQNSRMLSYLYQYLVGGAVFVFGLVLAWRAGEVGIATARQRRRLIILVAGLSFFALLQGILQWLAHR